MAATINLAVSPIQTNLLVGGIITVGAFGATAFIAETLTAPIFVNALPSKVDPVVILIAPLCPIIVPLKIELSLMLTAPLTNQYTLLDLVPLVKTTFEKVLVVSAP